MFVLLHQEQGLLRVIDVQAVSGVLNQIHKHEVLPMISKVQVLRVERVQDNGKAVQRGGRYRDVFRPALIKETPSIEPYLPSIS